MKDPNSISTAELLDEYFVVLVRDMITKDALPMYQTMINSRDGVRDKTGASQSPFNITWLVLENEGGKDDKTDPKDDFNNDEDNMAEKMLAREIKEGESIIVDVDSDGKVIVLNGNRGPPSCPPLRAPLI